MGSYDNCMGDASCNSRFIATGIDCKTRRKKEQKK